MNFRLAAAAVATTLVLSPCLAKAETCYELLPFGDIIRLSFIKSPESGNRKNILAYGNWISPSGFSMPVTGSLEPAHGTTGRRLGIIGTTPSTIADWDICRLDGKIGGAYDIRCTGSVPSSNSGTSIEKVSCTGKPTR